MYSLPIVIADACGVKGGTKSLPQRPNLVGPPHLTIFTTPSANRHSSPFAFLSFKYTDQALEVNLDCTFFLSIRKPNQCPPGDLALKIIPGGCNAKFP
nr:hypothetical protein CFP56_66655 [Quercus suber]